MSVSVKIILRSSVSIINTELIPTYEIKLMTEKLGMLDNNYITGI